MKHPNQEVLALHAGGDLGALARWRTGRHLAHCEACRQEIAGYRRMLSLAADLAEAPEIPWHSLAAEMKANIRLGLAAGECVRGGAEPAGRGRATAFRLVVVFASIAALVAAGITLDRPAPAGTDQPGIVAEATPGGPGIQLREGGQALRLLDSGARHVTYTAGAHGSMEARYVDRETGYITVNEIDVE